MRLFWRFIAIRRSSILVHWRVLCGVFFGKIRLDCNVFGVEQAAQYDKERKVVNGNACNRLGEKLPESNLEGMDRWSY